MQKFKIEISYDGTDYYGWQIQPKHHTISSCMQNAFNSAFGKNINIIGTSRTDTGVHALGQIASFKTDLKLQPEKILKIWNQHLPKSILIKNIKSVSNNFHPQANVHQKTYYYHLFLKKPLPFVARYGWFYKFINQVDLEKFKKILQLYVGKHDFASFCKTEEEKDTIRKIDNIIVKKFARFGIIQITIKGKSFLRFQIRRMIGYALDVSRQPELSIDYIKNILNTPNSQQQLIKAEGCGLCLKKIVYKNEINSKKRNV